MAATIAALLALPVAVTYWVRQHEGMPQHLATTGMLTAAGAAVTVGLVVGAPAPPMTVALALRRTPQLLEELSPQLPVTGSTCGASADDATCRCAPVHE